MDSLKIPIILLVACILILVVFANPFGGRSTTPRHTSTGSGTKSDPSGPATVLEKTEALAKAQGAFAKDDFDGMLKVLEPLKDIEDAAVQGLLGFAYAGKKDFDPAARAFEKALKAKRDPVFGYSLAYIYETIGEMPKARTLYHDLLRANLDRKTKAKVYLGLARSSLFANDEKYAYTAFEGAFSLDPFSEEAVIGMLKIIRNSGDIKDLEKIRGKADSLHKNKFNYHFWLGTIYYDLGKSEEALEHLRKCTKLDKENSSPFYFIYRILRRSRQIDKAVAELEEYYSRNPFLPYIFFQAALDAKASRRLDLAFKFLRSAITMDRALLGHDDKGTIYAVEKYVNSKGNAEEKIFMKAFSQFINSDFEGAYRRIQEALPRIRDKRLNEDAARLVRECQSIFARQQTYNSYLAQIQGEQEAAMAALRDRMNQAKQPTEPQDSAADTLKRQALTNPRDIKLQYGTALKLARMGDLDGAKVFLRETLRLNPKVHEAYYSLAKIAQFEGNTHQAQEYLRDALHQNPGSSQALSYSASIHLDQGDSTRAREEAIGALRSNPNNTEARLVLARMYQQEGRQTESLEEINLALATESDPERREAFLALKRQLGQ